MCKGKPSKIKISVDITNTLITTNMKESIKVKNEYKVNTENNVFNMKQEFLEEEKPSFKGTLMSKEPLLFFWILHFSSLLALKIILASYI